MSPATRLRWWLARLIAPSPIMADPFDASGQWVYVRREGYTVCWRVEKLRMKSTTNLEPLDFTDIHPVDFDRKRTFTRFVGTTRF